MLSQAVILCGGLGTRLGDLTASTPKPMLPVGGTPFLEVLIQEAARFGFEDLILLAGAFGNQIYKEYHNRTMFGARLQVVVEPAPLGTGGALRFALDALASEFLLLNGDSWIDADLTQFALAWRNARTKFPYAVAQILLHRILDPGRFGTVDILDGCVTAFREKDPAAAGHPGLINAGAYILRREPIADLPEDKVVSLENELLPNVVARTQVLAVVAPEGTYFVDIGVPESYARAQAELPQVRRRAAVFFDRDGALNEGAGGYTNRVDDLRWIPGAREAVAFANASGRYVFVITNQSSIARGLYPESVVVEFHRAMQASLFEVGAHIDAFEWCPHHIEGTVERYRKQCARRKPGETMLADLIASWPIDMERSIVIGDSDIDIQAASVAGLRAVRYLGGSLAELLKQETGVKE